MKRDISCSKYRFEFDEDNLSKEVGLLQEAYNLLWEHHSFFERKEDFFDKKRTDFVFKSFDSRRQLLCLLDSYIVTAKTLKELCVISSPSMDSVVQCLREFCEIVDQLALQIYSPEQKKKLLKICPTHKGMCTNEIFEANDELIKTTLKIYGALLAICQKLIPDDEFFAGATKKLKTLTALTDK